MIVVVAIVADLCHFMSSRMTLVVHIAANFLVAAQYLEGGRSLHSFPASLYCALLLIFLIGVLLFVR
jgi:hypothetical protein